MSRMPSGLSPHFNSRPSARGDDSGDAVQIYDLISIHAPPRGATGHEERIGGLRDDFNSRPSARGDTLVEKVKKLPDISIHAPPRGATHCLCFLRPQYSFQFTPLREGRPDCAGTRRLRKRISIHAPPRGATRFRGGTPQRPSYFNSRPSARGDDAGAAEPCFLDISIHAPPRGATGVYHMQNYNYKFQFTPLREGRPASRADLSADGIYFNSRPSARGDCPCFRPPPAASISIHAPPRGATTKRRSCLRILLFQFTPLREGRPGANVQAGTLTTISIHAPPRGATAVVAQRRAPRSISIHAPPRGATDEKCGNRTEEVFQFTPLREGRPYIAIGAIGSRDISIHAPPRGATTLVT